MDTPPELMHLPALARRLRVPVTWLRAESDAGRLPCVRAGKQRLFCVEVVERDLAERAASNDSERGPREERVP